MDRTTFTQNPEPNVVLCGGPLDGRATHVHPGWPPITVQSDNQECVYRPTGETDSEYLTLNIYVFDHAKPA